MKPLSLARLRVLPQPDRASTPRAEHIESHVSDAELVQRIVSGDQWAKEALYRRHVRSVWSTALRLLGSRADAEDVVQDTFAEALRDAHRLKKLEALRPWLLRIAVHQAHRRFRRTRLLRRFGLVDGADDATLSALAESVASPETIAELERVDRVLKSLPAGERFAWILRHVDGLSLEEVAYSCDCSLATAKRRIARATRSVEAHLDAGALP